LRLLALVFRACAADIVNLLEPAVPIAAGIALISGVWLDQFAISRWQASAGHSVRWHTYRHAACIPRAGMAALARQRSSRRLLVLVVDDDAASRSLLCDQVQDAGHACLTAINGRQALDVLGRTAIDLVILDLEMPVMDGWELRRRMLAVTDWAEIPAVVLSSHRVADGAALHVEQVIQKPIRPERLDAVLDGERPGRPEAGYRPAPLTEASVSADGSAAARTDSS
jgi:CheY-like chemotaxis protein